MKALKCFKLSLGLGLLGMIFFSPVIKTSALNDREFISVGVDSESHLEQARELFKHNHSHLNHLMGRNSQLTKMLIFDLIQKEVPKSSAIDVAELTKTVLAVSLNAKLDPILLLSIIKTESRFHSDAVGTHGEIGLMQIRPETAKWLARRAHIQWRGSKALFETSYNVRLGAEYLKYLRLRFGSDGQGYLSAYNLGVLKVRTMYKSQIRPDLYANKVLQNYTEYHQKYAIFSSGRQLRLSLALSSQ